MSELRHETREEILYVGEDAPAAFERAKAMVWGYRFYPPTIVEGTIRSTSGAPEVGARIEQRIHAGPITLDGPVRFVDVWDRRTPEGRSVGYRYEALPGHAERGEASFELKLEGRGVDFRIEASYAFEHWLARLGEPVARRLRRRALDEAFRRLRAAAEGAA